VPARVPVASTTKEAVNMVTNASFFMSVNTTSMGIANLVTSDVKGIEFILPVEHFFKFLVTTVQ
jgi:hypothetical protein